MKRKRSLAMVLVLVVALGTVGPLAQVVTRVSVWPDGSEFRPESASFAISPGRLVVLIGRDLMLKNLESGALERILSLPDTPQSLRFSADNRHLMFTARDGVLPLRQFLFDLTSRRLQPLAPPPGIAVTSGGTISADTRWVVYGTADGPIVHDRFDDVVTAVPGSARGDGAVAISDDGRRIIFLRRVEVGPRQILAYDRVSGTVERVDVDAPTLEGRSLEFTVLISGDGRYVAFDALCVRCDDPFRRLYIRDLDWRRTSQPIVGFDGMPPQLGVDLYRISHDGRYVLFESGSRNLVPGIVSANLFIVDRVTQRIIRVSGGQRGSDFAAAMNGDGLRVAFAALPIIPRGPGLTFSGYGPVFLSSMDADDDGMQDDWETLVGLSPANGADALEDADFDGMTNVDEYRAGMQPRARFQFRTRGEIDPEPTRLVMQNRNDQAALVWLRLVDRRGLWSATAVQVPARSTREIAFSDFSNRPSEPFVLHMHSDVLIYPRLSR